jgi:hypothetical protein
MKQWLLLCCLLFALSCKDKKADLSGETPISAADFEAAFPVFNTSTTITDTGLVRKADTTTIGYKALTQYFPDTALALMTGKDKKMAIHPVGLISKEKEKYFLFNITQHKKTRLVVMVTDKKMAYLASKELLDNQQNDGYNHFVSINKEPTFTISREKTTGDNVLKFTRTGWAFNTDAFMVVVNDSNEDPVKTAVINPIDTLPRKNKYSGDYVRNDKNYISIRDGKDQNTYLFFIHFEKNNGNCVGELKGDMKMKSARTAQFLQNGDPCVIDFNFDGNYVSMKEQGSCGNHRGIQCFFDDSFRKKREPKPKKKK